MKTLQSVIQISRSTNALRTRRVGDRVDLGSLKDQVVTVLEIVAELDLNSVVSELAIDLRCTIYLE